MCCFTLRDADLRVADTRIFGRLDGHQQWLAYQMTLQAAQELAMVLPLPIATRRDDAVQFEDLSRCARFFDQLKDHLWPPPPPRRSSEFEGATIGLDARTRLKVHAVGDYEASFVPSIADFDRLDPRFRMAPETWTQLREYGDWGFAVFKLRRFEKAARPPHPLAFRFETRFPEDLFFPTVHVHDGEVHPLAEFDHVIFFQADCDRTSEHVQFEEAGKRGFISWADASGLAYPDDQLAACAGALVRKGVALHGFKMSGYLPNRDTWFHLETA